MTRVSGQTVLVIGGSSGMGRGAARAVASRGGTVRVTSRSAGRLDAARAAVAEGLEPVDGVPAPGDVHATVCDLADPDSIRAAVLAPPAPDHLILTASPAPGGSDRDFSEGRFSVAGQVVVVDGARSVAR